VPERVWRESFALVFTWVDVHGVDNGLISLWNLGNSSGKFVDIWSNHSSDAVEDWVVKESYWDEELLPGESPSDLNKHSDESHEEFFGVFVRNFDVSNG